MFSRIDDDRNLNFERFQKVLGDMSNVEVSVGLATMLAISAWACKAAPEPDPLDLWHVLSGCGVDGPTGCLAGHAAASIICQLTGGS